MPTQDEIIARKRIREILKESTYIPPIINSLNLNSRQLKQLGDIAGFNEQATRTNDARLTTGDADTSSELAMYMRTLGYDVEYDPERPDSIYFSGETHMKGEFHTAADDHPALSGLPKGSWVDTKGNEMVHRFEEEFGDAIGFDPMISHIYNAKSLNDEPGGDEIAILLNQANYNPSLDMGPKIKFDDYDLEERLKKLSKLLRLLQDKGYNAVQEDEFGPNSPIIRIYPTGVDGSTKKAAYAFYESNDQANKFEDEYGAHLWMGEDCAKSFANITAARGRAKN